MLFLTVLPLALCMLPCFCAASEDPASHLKPFGWGKAVQIEEIEHFPSVKKFFEDYVLPNKPVVMRGANKVWPGFTNWQTDEYFLSKAPKEPFIVSMDVKRGTPDTPSDYVDYKDFLQKYNNSNRRMVEYTPPFLMQDVLVPGSLGCDNITQGEVLMGHKMWFGTNYTTSVVHKDAADNINCLVYGIKNYTVLAPKYDPNVFLDRPDGLYSTMEVDSVDAHKYPGLDNVEYQLTELHGGDCVFIPYKWIHQVRSYGRNIAVNIWWNHWKNKEIDIDSCPTEVEKKPITTAKFHGWGDFESRDEGVREHTHDLISMANVIKPLTYPRFVALFTSASFDDGLTPMELLKMVDADIKDALRDAFKAIDTNNDKRITGPEMDALPADAMQHVVDKIKYVLAMSRERSQQYEHEDKKQVADDLTPGLIDKEEHVNAEDEELVLAERDEPSKPVHDEM